MLRRVLAVLGIVALVFGSCLLMAEPGAVDAVRAVRGSQRGADDDVRPILRGRGESEVPTDPPWLEVLVAQTATGSDENRHAAVREIQRRYAAGEIPLEALHPWALSSAGQGGSEELARWARATLAEERPASLALLPGILRAGLDASEARQGAVAQTLRALETVRPEDVPLIQDLFLHEQTGYWLKRVLVDAMEDLGTATLPLAPQLVDFGAQVLKDRAQSMQEALDSGIHVSWDHVEYDIQRLLASMGAEVVPLLVERLEAFARIQQETDTSQLLFTDDPLGFVAGALVDAGLEGRRALARLLADDDVELRREAAWALAQHDEPLDPALFLDPLRAALGDADARVRRSAAKTVEHCGDQGIPLLLQAVGDPDADVRKAAAEALARLEVQVEHALPPLIDLLGDDDEFGALSAARSLATYGEQAVPALDALLTHLATDDLWFRARFAPPIASVAIHAPEALPRAWEGADAMLRIGLLRVVAEVDEPPADWTALLERGLEDPDLRVRVHAAARLATMGRRDVLAVLVSGVRSDDGPVRTTATATLAHFGGEAAHLLPVLLERLAQEDELWRPAGSVAYEQEESALDAAVRALGPYDLPRMFELIGHEDFNLSYAATAAFQAAGAEGIAYFEGAWDGATSTQRTAILDICRGVFHGEEKPELHAAVRHLANRGLSDPGPRVRLQAVETLERDPPSRDRRLDVLAELLDDSFIHTVRMAAYRISAQGAHAARVEAVLREHVDHPDDETRGYIRAALESIEDAR